MFTDKELRQRERLVRVLVEKYRGEEHDCFTLRNEIDNTYGVRFDHHDVAYELDRLQRVGMARVTRYGAEATRYFLNVEPDPDKGE